MAGLDERTRWEPAEAERAIFERWLESGLFAPEPDGTADENYSIAIPPPNVTGALHMGHALNGSVQDTLIRYNRMLGRRVRWILGTDHAGIATQTQVERLLKREGTSRQELGREAFVERVWQWREEYGGIIFKQFQRLGASCDYDHERFTLDDSYVRAVMKVFVDLHRKGLIYRDNRIVNWDPGSRSAISDLEVEEREVTDTLYHVDYQLASGGGSITVATVRPETMLADTAIAVHPDDERYTRLVGETAILPIVGRRLRIIADPYVKPEFGTGALKITPGHDPNDFEIGRAHGLEEITVIGEDGRMNERGRRGLRGHDAARGARGRRRRAARAGRARAHGALHARRAVLPPQRRADRAADLAAVVHEDGGARRAGHPGRARRRAAHPSRQPAPPLPRVAGEHPALVHLPPALVGPPDPRLVPRRGDLRRPEPPEGDGWERDPDVLDTWFSSGLWPFATLGWPDDTPELRAFYPTDVLSTGRDILFLWVARMVMLGIEFTGELPFSDVYNHSTILAPDGRRMSKSLGTGIDPLDVIDQHGADGTRFGLLAMSSTQDVRFSEEKVAQGRQLANKLFNASRLILLRAADGVAYEEGAAPAPQTVEDRWILSRLERTRAETAKAIEAFEFHRAALGLYDFVYAELCDWYLEIVKPRLYADDNAEVSAFALHVLAETLAIAHPVIPFVTEELWGHIPGTDGLLMGHPFPRATPPGSTPPPRRSWAARSSRSRSCAAGATGSAPRRPPCCPRASTPRATSRPRSTSSGSRGSTSPGRTAPSRWRRSPCRAAPSRYCPPTPSTSAPPSGGSTSAARGWTPRSPARRRSWPTRASWRRRPRPWSSPSAPSSPRSGRSATGCDLVGGAG